MAVPHKHRDPVSTPCVDCARPTIPQLLARQRPDLLASNGGRYVRVNAYGLCVGCYARARKAGSLPHPAPPESYHRPGTPPEVVVVEPPTWPVHCEWCGVVAEPTSQAEARELRLDHWLDHKTQMDRLVRLARGAAA